MIRALNGEAQEGSGGKTSNYVILRVYCWGKIVPEGKKLSQNTYAPCNGGDHP